MAHFVRHAKCPECTKLGKDRDGNNLGVYSDGSVYCFACGYTRNASPIQTYRDWETDRKSTRLNSSHLKLSRMPSSA